MSLANFENPDNFAQGVNELIIDEEFHADSQPPRQKPEYKKFFFPTSEVCQNPTALKGAKKEVYTELLKLQVDNIDQHINVEYQD